MSSSEDKVLTPAEKEKNEETKKQLEEMKNKPPTLQQQLDQYKQSLKADFEADVTRYGELAEYYHDKANKAGEKVEGLLKEMGGAANSYVTFETALMKIGNLFIAMIEEASLRGKARIYEDFRFNPNSAERNKAIEDHGAKMLLLTTSLGPVVAAGALAWAGGKAWWNLKGKEWVNEPYDRDEDKRSWFKKKLAGLTKSDPKFAPIAKKFLESQSADDAPISLELVLPEKEQAGIQLKYNEQVPPQEEHAELRSIMSAGLNEFKGFLQEKGYEWDATKSAYMKGEDTLTLGQFNQLVNEFAQTFDKPHLNSGKDVDIAEKADAEPPQLRR